jgi:hypothetical protein
VRIALLALAAALALTLAACGSDDAARSVTYPSGDGAGTDAPEVVAMRSLCDVRASLAEGDTTGAEATFQDDVHEQLHHLADEVETVDRTVSGDLLLAKSVVEDGFLQDPADAAALGAATDDLLSAMRVALGAVGLPAPACPTT